jgi:myo-inositol-1(or 4)-monophosphatase
VGLNFQKLKKGDKMKKSKTKIAKIIEGILQRAFVVLQDLGQKEGSQIIGSGEAFGDDIEIRADFLLGQTIADFLKEQKVNCRLQIEGREEMLLGPSPAKYYIAVDPLDGSLNFAKKGKTLGLPFSCSISVFSSHDKGECHFQDVEVAGCIDLRNGDLWLAEKRKGCFLNGILCHTSGADKIDIKKGIIIGEMYYPESRELLYQIFKGERGWLRNPGSSAYEMSLVTSGQVDAYICDRQKLDILGMAYLMVKEAGGAVIDFDGNDLGTKEYVFHSQMPVILAATKFLSSEILARMK